MSQGPVTSAPSAGPATGPDRELLAKRDRLTERFTAMQLDLGGVYYEMAIRDHIQHDVLIRKAAELQRVDAELRQVQQQIDGAGACAACGTPAPAGAVFCGKCGAPLSAAAPVSTPV